GCQERNGRGVEAAQGVAPRTIARQCYTWSVDSGRLDDGGDVADVRLHRLAVCLLAGLLVGGHDVLRACLRILREVHVITERTERGTQNDRQRDSQYLHGRFPATT